MKIKISEKCPPLKASWHHVSGVAIASIYNKDGYRAEESGKDNEGIFFALSMNGNVDYSKLVEFIAEDSSEKQYFEIGTIWYRREHDTDHFLFFIPEYGGRHEIHGYTESEKVA